MYERRKDIPWLNRLRSDVSNALYDELAMPAISPVDENWQLLGGSASVQPE